MSSYDRMRGLLSDRPVAFHPQLARMLGGINAALFFQQIAFWSNTKLESGKGYGAWIWKTQSELRSETALTRYEQESARKHLRCRGVLEEKRRGVPAKLYYRIVWQRFFEMATPEPSLPVREKVPDKGAEVSLTGWRESSEQAVKATTIKSAEKPHTKTEIVLREVPEKEEPPSKPPQSFTEEERLWIEVALRLMDSGDAPGWFRPWFKRVGISGSTLTVCLPTTMRVGDKTFADVASEGLGDRLSDLWREVAGDPGAVLVLEAG